MTLVELLVVLAILGILIGLVMVAVQRARESARRSGCLDNLRQMGVALHAYHDAIRALPPAVIWSPPGEPLGEGQLPIGVIDRVARYGDPSMDTIYANWAIMLLPQIGEPGLYATIDQSRPISHAANAAARSTQLAVFRCASDAWAEADNPFVRGMAAGLEGNEYARGNYGINGGPDSNCVMGTLEEGQECVAGFIATGGDLRTKNDRVWGSGIAGVNRSFQFAEITDGLSNTVALDELRAGLSPLDPRGVWALGQIGSSVLARHGKHDDAGVPNHCNKMGEVFIGCSALIDALGDALEAECMHCAYDDLTAERNVQAGSRSMHPNGVNLLFCDSSAGFIADTIDPEVWHALHTRDQGDSAESAR